jgi:demethylmenaquinone methyltransferase/2-methoxy-6-polyprenyl-1,4-benzoquinol methylase
MGSLTYAEQLELAGRVTEPAIRSAITELAPPRGSSGLDAGCGAGNHSLWLAEAVGTGGKVTALDISSENLTYARQKTGGSEYSERMEFIRGDLLNLPFRNGSFDWVWCADTLWPVYITDDPPAAVRELARIVRPGGLVALVYWSSQSLLPGYPELEARLNKAFTETTRYLAGISPGQHHLRAMSWLEAAGLRDPTVRSFIAEVRPPLSPEMRQAVTFCFFMLWGKSESRVSEEDWREYQRICDPSSEDFILADPSYYAFAVYTIFYGYVGG